jgi:hypothetical protein
LDDESRVQHAEAEVLIQSAIVEVAQADLGDDQLAVMDALDVALADRGIGEQPRPWVEAVARSIIIGSPYVESARTAPMVVEEADHRDRA